MEFDLEFVIESTMGKDLFFLELIDEEYDYNFSSKIQNFSASQLVQKKKNKFVYQLQLLNI